MNLQGGEIMRTPKYHLYLNNTAYKEIINAIDATAVLTVKEAESGDVNGDSEITIADINSLIDMVLAGVVVNARRADVNGDGEVNIADINAVINMILGA